MSQLPKAEEVEQVDNWFTYHAPEPAQIESYGYIRDNARTLAMVILMHCPPCADRTAALRKLREAVMTANAATACEGK